MPRNEYVRFQLRRFQQFLKQLRRSKRAVLGIVILIGYTVFGIVSPLLTPYDPVNSQFLSGVQGPPAWWRNVPGWSHLSQNMELIATPGFTQPSSLTDQGWVVKPSPASYASYEYNSSVTIEFPTLPAVYPGGEDLNYERTAGNPTPSTPTATITVSKDFYWPYTGPPARFFGSLYLLPTKMQGVNSIDVSVFIAKQTQEITIWSMSLDSSFLGKAIIPNPILDSQSSGMKAIFRTNIDIDPASFIFLEEGTYTYGFKVSIPDTQPSNDVAVTVSVNGLNLKLHGTSWGLLGTDQFGRDLFTQLAWGTRVSLVVGLVASFLAIAIGLLVGLIAGFTGRIVDEVLMRSTDLLLVLPGLPLLIVLAALLGPSFWNVVLIIGLLGWAGFARIIRSQVLSLKERSFIEASKAAGSGTFHMISRHVVPNVLGLTWVNLALAVPSAIVSEAALAFLGLFDPTVISWGKMLFDVQSNNGVADWWWVLPPGLSIAALSLSFVLLGYALDELLNPRLRMRR